MKRIVPLECFAENMVEPDQLVPGALLKSGYSLARRVVVDVDDEQVRLRSPDGKVERVPLRAVCRAWRCIGHVAE